jgi:hypothetical protein
MVEKRKITALVGIEKWVPADFFSVTLCNVPGMCNYSRFPFNSNDDDGWRFTSGYHTSLNGAVVGCRSNFTFLYFVHLKII